MSQVTFDELDQDQGPQHRNLKPLWTIDLDDPGNERQILSWLNQEIQSLEEAAHDRLETIRGNNALYKGIQYMSMNTRSSNRDSETVKKKNPVQKIVANHLYDLTENLVSRDVKYRPAVAILPETDDFEKEIAATYTQNWLEYIWDLNHFDGELMHELARLRRIHGEGYIFVKFDREKGELHPDYKKAAAKGQKIPLLDDDNEPQKDDQGNPIFVEQPVRIGEVSYEVEFAYNVFFERAERYSDAKYVFRKRVYDTDELKIMYPTHAAKIKSTTGDYYYDAETMELKALSNKTIVYEFYHRTHRTMSKGRKIVFSADVLLENQALEDEYNEIEALPCLRLPDIIIPGEQHARSFYENVKGLCAVYNNVTNLIVRNQMLASHPKWMLPAGSAKLESLGNDVTVVQFKGPVAPKLEQSNPTPNEVFGFREKIKEDFQQIAAVFGVSRGEPPAGIEAGISLQFLNEQENDRHNGATLTLHQFIRRLAQLTISVAAHNYDDSDERSMRIMGKNGKWMHMVFEPKNLRQKYDIRIQNSSAFQYSKTARLNTLVWLQQKYPDKISQDQVLDMVEFAQVDKYIDAATMALKSAEMENHILLQGKPVPEPAAFESLIVHWRTHIKPLQEFSYKVQVPKAIQKKLEDHIMATEMLMVQKAQKNATFMQMLMTLEQFPIFYTATPEQPEPSPEDLMVMEQEQEAIGQVEAMEEPLAAGQMGRALAMEDDFEAPPMVQEENLDEQSQEPLPLEEQIQGREPRPSPLDT